MTTKEKRIKLIDPVVGEDELQMIREVLESGWLTEGPVTKEFEESQKIRWRKVCCSDYFLHHSF